MKIGELAQRTGTATETIRFYEREGLLPPAPRSEGNYRLYGTAHQERLLLIRRCRSLDMSLDEIKALLAVRDAPEASCEAVNALLTQHLGHVAERLAELTALQAELLALRDAGCAILVVSEELDELFEISDRLVVIARGRLSPALPVAEATVERIGSWMSGLWTTEVAGDAHAAA
jgi:Cd(II)/Pb(II)-responsive transcriptional regulator